MRDKEERHCDSLANTQTNNELFRGVYGKIAACRNPPSHTNNLKFEKIARLI